MAELNSKIKAATLMESLIAMIIIVVCFGVAVMIYSNVLDSDKQRLKLKAILILNQESVNTKNEKKFIDENKTVDEWTIKKTVEHYTESENLYDLSFAAIDKEGKVIARRDELVIIE